MLSVNNAQQRGYKIAETNSANPSMIRVNEKIGFVRGRGEVRLVRKLAEQSQEPAMI